MTSDGGKLILICVCCSNSNDTHKLSYGVSCERCVGDLVLHDWPLCVIPADAQGARGCIKHSQIPGSSARHCTCHSLNIWTSYL